MSSPIPVCRSRYVVLGSGLAGLYFALEVADRGTVTILTKGAKEASNTSWAQGGISAVFASDDSVEEHVADTERVGAGLCHPKIVRRAAEYGPRLVTDLAKRFGVRFDREPSDETSDRAETSSFELGREGGHSRRRVVHHRDSTGAEISRALLDAVANHPNITLLEDHIAVDLLSFTQIDGSAGCFGCYALDVRSGLVKAFVAPTTVLATGGAGKVYRYTSNPDVATGDGIAMGYRIGASVANLEFMQFHPTSLHHPEAKNFLITEAMRGEGGILRRADGSELMAGRHPQGNLAPRDVVAREIDAELKRSGQRCVGLDVTHLDPEFLERRFPAIFARCLELGVDIRHEPIPVVPAAHYMCGGIVVDEYSRTEIPGLLAIGEVAMTGLHGACRLASNSLLEAVVGAHLAATACDEHSRPPPSRVETWNEGDAVESHEAVMVSANWEELRALMWNFVGIVRSDKRLARARRRVEVIREEILEYYWRFRVTKDMLELRNIALVAHLIIECAARRQESRGLHYTLDYPDLDPRLARDTVLRPNGGPVA